MVREIRVHYDDKRARSVFQPMHVGGTETELAGSGFEDDVGRVVEVLELLGDFEGAVGGAVVDDYDFPVEVA